MSTKPKAAAVVSTLAGDPFMGDLVEEFAAGLPGRVAEMDGHVAAGDWGELRRLVHQIKGAAGSFGYATVSQTAAGLERQILDKAPAEAIRAGYDELRALMVRVV